MFKFKYIVSVVAILCVVVLISAQNKLPVIAIANYGPHSSLSATIDGFKARMQVLGYEDDVSVRYLEADVSFDSALIPQMLMGLQAKSPSVLLALTTPIAQAAKAKVTQPVVFSAITDPGEAGLLGQGAPMQGSSDQQDISLLLRFAKQMLPKATRAGLMYASAEANDVALLRMMQDSAEQIGMQVVAIPVEQSRDITMRVQAFRDKVDFIYVGASGPIQPALPAIAAQAKAMGIPVFNLDEQAVADGIALASYGVNYRSVGANAADLVVAILEDRAVEVPVIYPGVGDHYGYVNKELATVYGAHIPEGATVIGVSNDSSE